VTSWKLHGARLHCSIKIVILASLLRLQPSTAVVEALAE